MTATPQPPNAVLSEPLMILIILLPRAGEVNDSRRRIASSTKNAMAHLLGVHDPGKIEIMRKKTLMILRRVLIDMAERYPDGHHHVQDSFVDKAA